MTLLRAIVILAIGIALGAGLALAASVTCPVAASGGYANCLNGKDPDYDTARSSTSSGTSYRFQLHRAATSSTWGWWEISHTNVFAVSLSLSGTITAQVDYRGSGTVDYTVSLD